MDRLPEEVQSVRRSAEELAKSLGIPIGSNTSTANINVNAGGVGVWIATTCCIVMVVISIFGGMTLMTQQHKIDELYNYISAIYAQAPQLKPKEHPQ